MKIAVIGGGPSGMMAAIKIAENGKQVDLFEKNEKTGKKLYITGKGRCNITNDCDETTFLKNVVSNPKFMYKAIFAFPPEKTMEFFENYNVPLKVERGNRVFPLSDKSSDILKAFNLALQQNKVKVILNTKVNEVEKKDNIFVLDTTSGKYNYDVVVIATGGVTYQQTGSDGDGYTFAKKFSHDVIAPVGVLNGLILSNNFDLAGLTLKNVTFNVEKKGKTLFSEMGEMLFTHKGVSGPIVLSASSYIARENIKQLYFYIDLKPALSYEMLDNRLLRDFSNSPNKLFKSALVDLLPQRLINEVIKKTQVDPNKQLNSVTKEEREILINTLKKFSLSVEKIEDNNFGIITSGGVSVNEINPKNMQSKIVENLFFVGEVVDVDAVTGGFNLQIALSTGYICGEYIGKME